MDEAVIVMLVDGAGVSTEEFRPAISSNTAVRSSSELRDERISVGS